jgi:hypothetical protein
MSFLKKIILAVFAASLLTFSLAACERQEPVAPAEPARPAEPAQPAEPATPPPGQQPGDTGPVERR